MLNEKPGGDLTNGGLRALRQPVYEEKQLILLWLDIVFSGFCVAEMKELANQPSKLGKLTILFVRDVPHGNIVRRYFYREAK
jgi:hypothetical protein